MTCSGRRNTGVKLTAEARLALRFLTDEGDSCACTAADRGWARGDSPADAECANEPPRGAPRFRY